MARTRAPSFSKDNPAFIPDDLAEELGLPKGMPLGMEANDPPREPREPPDDDPDGEPTYPPDEDGPDEDDPGFPGDAEPDPRYPVRPDPRNLAGLSPVASYADRPSTGPTSYESRIRILSAWQYSGVMKTAPAWVDRNWLAWGDYDQLRNIEPGPALRIPMPNGENVMCRIGDYVCRQSVTLSPDVSPEIRIEVWEQKQFERLFLPSSANIVGVTRTIEHDPLTSSEQDVGRTRSSPVTTPGRAPPA